MMRQEFLNAYYHWSLEDALRECAAEFPLVSRVKGRMALRFLRHARLLGPSRSEALMRALVQRFHPSAAAAAGHRLDPDAALLIEDMRVALRSACPEEPHEGNADHGPGRRQLTAAIDDRLGSVLGGNRRPLGGSQWFYEHPCGGLKVRTFIDVGGRTHQLTYHHRIDAPGLPEIGGWISLFSWLGIAGQTQWDLLGPDDAVPAADSLAVLWSHLEAGFLRKASALF